MQNLYLMMTLGNDPHTEGCRKAGRIANMLDIPFRLLSPETADEEKINVIKQECPSYLGLSYRLSPEKAILELKKFLQLMEKHNALSCCGQIAFAGLLPTLNEVRRAGLDHKYSLYLIGSYSKIEDTVGQTIDFFRGVSDARRQEVIRVIKRESEPERIGILDEIAKEVLRDELYLLEPPLPIPNNQALASFRERIRQSSIPVIRSHYGEPGETIEPAVKGIRKIATHRVIDELSLGSSDLSQRYYGEPDKFLNRKNDGGVPYKNRQDLERLFLASRHGNFPAVKPYCHVKNIIPFIDECLSIGMLKGGHQAIPLFWFNELDGRGDMTVGESIDEHLRAVRYLCQKGIPVEMNDPNQWSSRLVHDTLFVVSYCLIASVMFEAGAKDLVVQCQFNKPATTGDYADLAKMMTAQYFIERLRPHGNQAQVHYECRAGIEHFSVDQEKAKLQLARTTLLQMLIKPDILHLVSYCEADHIATADDVIESSKILRRAVHLFRKYEPDIRAAVKWDIVKKRGAFLKNEVYTVLSELIALSGHREIKDLKLFSKYLAQPETLKAAMDYRFMTAPGIASKNYSNAELLTKVGEHGFVDCYKNWEDKSPLTEKERIEVLKIQYNLKPL